jgi:hypothetical protein
MKSPPPIRAIAYCNHDFSVLHAFYSPGNHLIPQQFNGTIHLIKQHAESDSTTIEIDPFTIYHRRPIGTACYSRNLVVVTGPSYPSTALHSLFQELRSRFHTDMNPKEAREVLQDCCTKYNRSNTELLQEKIISVQETALVTVDDMLVRAEKVEVLYAKSFELRERSDDFRNRSVGIHRDIEWQRIKYKVLVAVAFVIFIVVIIVLSVTL